ncbi:hypothetical protein RBB68_00415 [Leptospira interrogans]|uniref:Uncharacterized protein n=3 Tax=Leptospira interrogans TaxID=173 RepID=Q8F9U5_LEPIN|nr:hypothetical protein [Leptospira interrogans]AAN47293.1 hypothetical protein LA_0094 [Leptospira interrogans serovar Lai str. 56601]AER00903.1 hypothetical protein LIF_A0081 [Leptospira interrogans serovar Lai str. IPAV]AKH75676.1 hypothetical protein BRAT_00435 [Leptospira interrogans serovar Bratislava]EJP01670.1 hypothetical protein LEP1GSC007_3976 [Leptospira interrogans serovar Bulgarica str. Mallika]EKR16053.1 hypothetical protein LEP1GSC019_1005 [Leptospira interrogans serovar Pyroge
MKKIFVNSNILKKKIFIFFIFALGIGISIWIIIQNFTNYQITVFSNISNETQKSIVQTSQNQNSEKIIEGCKILPLNEKFKNSTSEHLRGGAICNFTIHRNLPIYKFHLVGGINTYNVFDRIEISKGSENVFVQTLKIERIDSPQEDEEFFVAEDMNFDGYKDIRLILYQGETGNKGYTFWLFDPSKNFFIENKELNELVRPVFDLKTKTIQTHYHISACEYINQTYKIAKNGKLIQISEETQEWIEKNKSFRQKIGKLKNGTWVYRTRLTEC